MSLTPKIVPKRQRGDEVVYVSETEASKNFDRIIALTRRRVPKFYAVSSDQYQRWLKVESMARLADWPAELQTRAISKLGSDERARRWLQTYNLALECVPAQAVRDGRIGGVNDLLNSIESS